MREMWWKNVRWSWCKLPVILVILLWNLNNLYILQKTNKYNKHSSSGSLVVLCGLMDGHTRRSWWLLFAILRKRLKIWNVETKTFLKARGSSLREWKHSETRLWRILLGNNTCDGERLDFNWASSYMHMYGFTYVYSIPTDARSYGMWLLLMSGSVCVH
jgi:hypothetical protein